MLMYNIDVQLYMRNIHFLQYLYRTKLYTICLCVYIISYTPNNVKVVT